ncbi:MAG: hypothetical protein HY909_11495 [Deltaproteobacteria bacterium]|nr:hypothetical protein [Deltaproteobacteria bacterium]
MVAEPRALEVFEAFLRHARGAGGPAPAVTTEPSRGGEDLTRVSSITEALASSVAPLPPNGSPWEETTRERPDVVREMVAVAFPEAQSPHEEQSIIVEDDTLTQPEFENDFVVASPEPGRSPVTGHPGPMPVEQFVQEMSVLIKYGHAGQAAAETDRWIAAHPDDLSAHLKIADFELARLDREGAINRFISLATRLLERGDSTQARDVVRKLRQSAPEDLRVGALANRLGRS